MSKEYKFCQSCGMPMKKDPKGGGSNADGSKNIKYCSYCYEDGEFTQKDLSLEEMKLLVRGQLKKQGIPGFLTYFFTIGMSRLERWN